MNIQPSIIGAAIGKLIAAAETPDLTDGVRGVIDLCERDAPHPAWAALRALDYQAEVPALRAWFERTLAIEPPQAPLRGLYFPLGQIILQSGEVTTDMQMVGTANYDPADRRLDWLFSRNYFPETYAGSSALHQLYGTAYGTHDSTVEVEGVLGNDAEWSIGLTYAVLAARILLDGRTTSDLLTDSVRIGVAAGWGEGDLLFIGEITATGFVPSARGA